MERAWTGHSEMISQCQEMRIMNLECNEHNSHSSPVGYGNDWSVLSQVMEEVSTTL